MNLVQWLFSYIRNIEKQVLELYNDCEINRKGLDYERFRATSKEKIYRLQET